MILFGCGSPTSWKRRRVLLYLAFSQRPCPLVFSLCYNEFKANSPPLCRPFFKQHLQTKSHLRDYDQPFTSTFTSHAYLAPSSFRRAQEHTSITTTTTTTVNETRLRTSARDTKRGSRLRTIDTETPSRGAQTGASHLAFAHYLTLTNPSTLVNALMAPTTTPTPPPLCRCPHMLPHASYQDITVSSPRQRPSRPTILNSSAAHSVTLLIVLRPPPQQETRPLLHSSPFATQPKTTPTTRTEQQGIKLSANPACTPPTHLHLSNRWRRRTTYRVPQLRRNQPSGVAGAPDDQGAWPLSLFFAYHHPPPPPEQRRPSPPSSSRQENTTYPLRDPSPKPTRPSSTQMLLTHPPISESLQKQEVSTARNKVHPHYPLHPRFADAAAAASSLPHPALMVSSSPPPLRPTDSPFLKIYIRQTPRRRSRQSIRKMPNSLHRRCLTLSLATGTAPQPATPPLLPNPGNQRTCEAGGDGVRTYVPCNPLLK
ncbi:hypothetical protein R3P38DRAFT_3267781 [Favolaschia claudopus]|uniref:Uncharacterized protein n=1 Tax=Favolaschia claudopus TaxID=2862362 RepID=A0AAW0BNL8_9AGAR